MNNLKALMEYFDIDQVDIVNKTGIPKSSLSCWVSNTRSLRTNKAQIIADAYGVDPVWLMGFDVPMFKKDAKELAREYFELEEKYKKLNDRDKQLILSMMDNMIKAYE